MLYKNIGLGKKENVLKVDDPRVKEFFDLIDTGIEKNRFHHGIGFDSCSIAGILNFTNNIDKVSIDTCESARWSMYITPDMKGLPCSFDNQDLKWAYDISNNSIFNAWYSKQFENYRDHLRYSCLGCKDYANCRGGCAIRRDIVLCNRSCKNQK